MRVFLTGATGFIGSHVADELLARGHQVTALVRTHHKPWWMLEENVSTTLMIDDAKEADCVIGLGWITTPGVYLESEENLNCLEDNRRLLAACTKRAVFAGTCFEYQMSDAAIREDGPLEPKSLYARSKDELRREVEARPNSAWARFFYLYGPRENEARFIPKTIRRLLVGEEVLLNPGGQHRDYLYVKDAARAVVDVAESAVAGCVNISSGDAPTVGEIARILGEKTGNPKLVRMGASPYKNGEAMVVLGDNRKLRSTGWRPSVSLEEGLEKTVAWWRERADVR